MATTTANKAICISDRMCKSIIGLWDQRGGGRNNVMLQKWGITVCRGGFPPRAVHNCRQTVRFVSALYG